MRRAVAAAAALAICAPIAALAHGPTDPRIRYAPPEFEPAAAGVSAEIAAPALPHLGPQILVKNTSGQELVLAAPAGEPFLRIGPQGTFGNVRSAFLGPAINPGQPAAPSPGGPEPLWKQRARGTSFRWYERRAAYTGHAPRRVDAPSVLETWIVPARLGTAPLRLVGEIQWRPVLGMIEPSIVTVSPEDPKVDVRVLPGPVPAIQLRNGSTRTIEITGRDNRPFARIGPDGMEINVNSATHRDTRSLPLTNATSVDWQKQPGQTVLVWLERRAAYNGEAPAEVQNSRKRTVLKQWTVPGTIGTEALQIRGATTWIPAAERIDDVASRRSGVWPILVPILGMLAAVAIGIVLRRARGTA